MSRALGDWDAMLRTYETAMAADIRTAEPGLALKMHLALGGLYLDRARTADGLRELAAAQTTRPDAARMCRCSKRSRTASSTGNDTAATAALRRASTLNPNDAMTAYVLGRHLSRTGATEDAARAYDSFVASEARRPVQNQPQPTMPFIDLRLFQETSGIEPFFPPALYADGFAELQRGNLPRAIELFRQGVTRDPLVAESGVEAGALRTGGRGVARRIARPRCRARRGRDRAGAGSCGAASHQWADPSGRPAARCSSCRAHCRDHAEPARRARAARARRRADHRRQSSSGQRVTAGAPQGASLIWSRAIHARTGLPAAGPVRRRDARAHRGRRHEAAPRPQQRLSDALARWPVRSSTTTPPSRPSRSGSTWSRTTPARTTSSARCTSGRAGTTEALAEFTAAVMLNPTAPTRTRRSLRCICAAATMPRPWRRPGAPWPWTPRTRRRATCSRHRLSAWAAWTKASGSSRRISACRPRRPPPDRGELEIEGLRRDASVSIVNGEFAKAVALLRQALERDPQSAQSHLDLGLALLKAGQPAEAIEHLTTATATDNSEDVTRHLARGLRGTRARRAKPTVSARSYARMRAGRAAARGGCPLRTNRGHRRCAFCLATGHRRDLANAGATSSSSTSPRRPASTSSTSTAPAPTRHLYEIMSGGGLFFDYDNDGWLDVFLVDGGSLTDRRDRRDARGTACIRNRGNGTFEDVTAVVRHHASPATAWAPAPPTTTTTAGSISTSPTSAPNTLYHNNGGKAFTDVTRTAGVGWRAGRSARAAPSPTSIATATSTCSSSTTWTRASTTTSSAATPRSELRIYCHPLNFAPLRIGALPQQRQRHLHRRQPRGRHRATTAATASASSSATTTMTAGRTSSWPTTRRRTSCITTRQGQRSREVGAARPACRWRATACRAPAWAPTSATTTATGASICSSPTTSSRRTRSSATSASGLFADVDVPKRRRPRHAALRRLRHAVLRLRQRRRPRPRRSSTAT